jgi:hypothetical protein
MLRGDILLGHRGAMEPGSYFWRPANVEHGPMFSLNGGTFFFRSKGGNLATCESGLNIALTVPSVWLE